MKIALNIVGIVLLLLGGLWALQGSNVLAGSVMSGHSIWLIVGVVLVLISIGVLYFANMPKRGFPLDPKA